MMKTFKKRSSEILVQTGGRVSELNKQNTNAQVLTKLSKFVAKLLKYRAYL